jgi:hypothetical protein
MPDPAEKSDDLIAELAKMMATPAEPAPAPPPPVTAAPPPVATSPAPVRIPGMDAPRPVILPTAATTAAPPVDAAPRAPVTGVIRIPGMDQPAPVATSAPVGRLDFGRSSSTVPTGPEPLTSLADRIAARAAEMDARPKAEPPPSAAIRFPELRTVSENKSFATGPAIVPQSGPPAAAPAPAGDFTFDFGFSTPAQASAQSASARPVAAPPAVDPIAALINADMEHPTPQARPTSAAIPVLRTTAPPAPPKPAPTQAPSRPAANAPIPLRPVTQRPPEADRFTMAPGAGLNMRMPASQPLNAPVTRAPDPPAPEDSDPMSEIENLIGEAVRVELTTGPVRVQTAQPVVAPHVAFEPEADVEEEIHSDPPPFVPPLTTQFAPRRAAIKDEGHAAAEDAILAAAAATGTPLDRLEPSMAEESPYRRLKVKPQRANASGGLRQYVGMAVAGTLLLAAGLGLYWVLNMGRTANLEAAKAPQLTASTAAVKEVAKVAEKPVTDVTKSPVLQQMAGVSAPASAEQLVTTDQTAGAAAVDTPVAVATQADTSEGGLANRKVRTVTVRPDGTIVPGDDAVAGNAALLVDRPNVPSVPSTETTNLLGNDNATPEVAATTASGLVPLVDIPDTPATAATDDTQPVIDTSIVPPKPMSFPVRSTTASAPRSSVNAVIDQTPTGQINLLGADALAPAKTAPVAAAPRATAVASAGGGAPAYVQLASSLSEADANTAVKAATAKFGSVFEGNKLMVQQADLGTKGIRWRVRLPASSLGDANGICAQIKALGGDCFATAGG